MSRCPDWPASLQSWWKSLRKFTELVKFTDFRPPRERKVGKRSPGSPSPCLAQAGSGSQGSPMCQGVQRGSGHPSQATIHPHGHSLRHPGPTWSHLVSDQGSIRSAPPRGATGNAALWSGPTPPGHIIYHFFPAVLPPSCSAPGAPKLACWRLGSVFHPWLLSSAWTGPGGRARLSWSLSV